MCSFFPKRQTFDVLKPWRFPKTIYKKPVELSFRNCIVSDFQTRKNHQKSVISVLKEGEENTRLQLKHRETQRWGNCDMNMIHASQGCQRLASTPTPSTDALQL